VVGKLLAPRVLDLLHRFGTDETIVLFTIGLILGVSLLAAWMEFSLALGGFVAGAILAKSSLAHEIETLTEPLRNFFSALFFVSVGTFVDLREMAEYWLPIVLLTLLMMSGKFISCWLGMVLAGQKPAVSTRASMGKVQIGEFGFVIAGLGLSYGVVDAELKAIAYGVAILSISLTPGVNKLQSKISAYVETRVPFGLKRGIAVYLNWIETARLAAGQSGIVKVAVRPFSRIIISFLLVNAIVILASVLVGRIPVPENMADFEVLIQRSAWGVAALLCLPFLVDIVRNLNVLVTLFSEIALARTSAGAVGRFMRELIQGVFLTLVLLVFSLVFLAACGRYFPTATAIFGFILVYVALAILFWRRVVQVHSRFEYALIQGMEGTARRLVKLSMEESIRRVSTANPWPVQIHEMPIKKQTWACGQRVRELDLRNRTGATIVAIERGGRVYYDVGPDMPLSPEDRVHLLGEAEQIEAAEAFMNRPLPKSEVPEPRFRHFDKILVGPTADLVGTSLLEADFRSRSGVTVVGIQRGEDKIIGPAGGEVIHAGDLLLVLGRTEDVDALKKRVFDS
jgi:CPA2 family monovalent cation:H+ antiporter-2